MRNISLLLICIVLALSAGKIGASASSEADIQGLVVSYPSLFPISEYNVELVNAFSREDFTQRVNIKGVYFTATLPYGEYILRVKRGGFIWYEQHLIVMQPQISFRVFLRVDTFGNVPPVNVCRGTIIPKPPQNARLWVRIVPLTDTGVYAENEIVDGMFQVRGLPDGEYVLVVMKGRESLYLKQITMLPPVDLSINLPESAYDD